MPELSDNIERKFIDVIELVDEWEIETDTGWKPLTHINKTMPYEKWHLETVGNNYLDAADTHIIFDENIQEIFVKDIMVGQLIQTKNGPVKVTVIENAGTIESMFDVTVNSDDHRFYSNNILSHNTVTAAGYLLWAAMFNSDQTILIAAHKFAGASEIMSRIKFAYENTPDHIRAGISEYNKQSVSFDNGSRIVAQTTTETTGRGMSISILYCLGGETMVHIRDKDTLLEEHISLSALYTRLYNPDIIFAENTQYEIMTPTGWQSFRGVTLSGNKPMCRLVGENTEIIAAPTHSFFQNGIAVAVKDLRVNDNIDAIDGPTRIKSIDSLSPMAAYDIIECSDVNHQFIINDSVITKNCDEMAFIKRQQVAREFWTSVSLTLSTGGKAIITSTPNSSDDLFAEIWHNANKTVDNYGDTIPGGLGSNGFRAFQASWDEHPERDAVWAEEQKAAIGDERFAREILCQFVIFEETLINAFKLNTLQGIEPITKEGQIRWYGIPKKGNIYLVAMDPSLGTGGDPSAIQVFEANTNKQIAEWVHNKTVIEKQVALLKEITTYLAEITGNPSDIYYTVENNTIGEAILVAIRDIGEENIPGIFLSEPIKLGQSRKYRKGFCTTNTSKLSACAKLKNFIESDKLTIYSKKLISELRTFVSVGNTYQAKSGETDDLVLALLSIVRMNEVLKTFLPELNNDDYSATENAMPLPFIVRFS